MLLVSVIIPNYNHALFLKERLDSVLNQTFQNFEVIILDDSSTDNSREIIEEYRNNPKIKHIIYNSYNSGSPFKQWNKGIALSKSDYIWIAESDDYCELNFLEIMIPLLENNTKASLAYCLSQEVDTSNHIASRKGWWTEDLDALKWKKSHIQNGREACKNYFVHKNIIPNASAVLFKKSLFYKAGCAPEKMIMCGDYFLWIKMLLKHDYVYSSEPLNFQRTHLNTTRNINSFNKHRQKIIEELSVQYLINENLDTSNASKNRIIDLFTSWIYLHENKNRFSSVFFSPPFYNMNRIKYFLLVFKCWMHFFYAISFKKIIAQKRLIIFILILF